MATIGSKDRQGKEKMGWLTVMTGCLVLLFLVFGMLSSPQGVFVLVITHPSGSGPSPMSVISAADGVFVGSGSVPWVTVAYSESASFPARLRSAGALLVLNPGLISICRQERKYERARQNS